METNSVASKHSSSDRKEHHEKKRKKLDRSALGLNENHVRNGVDEKVLKSPSVKKEIGSHEKPPSLKRPAASGESDDDDIPLVARSKLKLSVSTSNKLERPKSSQKDSPSSNDVKKIKKIKPESSSSTDSPSTGSPKGKKPESHGRSTTPGKSDGIKKLKTDSGTPKKDGVKTTKPSSSFKSDGTKKVKHELDASVKIKSESGLKSPDRANKSKGSLLNSYKTDEIRKEKQKTARVDSVKPKEGSSTKTEKDTLKTTSSGKNKESSGLASSKVDGIKKEKSGKTNSSGSTKPESNNSAKPSKDSSGLTSPKLDGIKKEKHKDSSPKVDGVKKIKSETNGSASPGEKKSKLSSSDGTKKIKSENESSSSSKVSSGEDTTKTSTEDSDEDDVPLAARAKVKTESPAKKKIPSSKDRKRKGSDDDDDDYKPLKKKKSDVGRNDVRKEKVTSKKKEKPKKGKDNEKIPEKKKKEVKKEKKEEEVWKWWEEEKHPDGIKWLTLEHKGPYFPPEYEPLPDSVNFYYDGEKIKLSLKSEEVAGFYAKMLEHDYTSKKIFNDNFFGDWRKEMTDEERKLIKNLSKCDFKELHAYYVQKNEERKNMSKEEKLVVKEKNEAILQEYGYCLMDNHKERVGNFKIEPPGLFRGRGDHPKQGKLKKRLQAKDVIINIGKDAKVPDPPEGQKWKAVSHDNKVTWLACWIENIQGSYKYVMLNPTSRIKGEKDWQKYETARKLKGKIGKIRSDYTNDWRSKEMRIRQRGVALYFIDKLALRAGHEKDEDTADTVGCCSLRYEHIKLHKQLEDKEFVVEFDFLGKDSIHYHNIVEVEKRVFKNLELFQQGKSEGDDLFDRLSTTSLNKYLSELMEGLSAKVFRTYNASMTLQDQLNKMEVEDNVAANILGYNRANRAVAILCNHQRSAPKTFEQSMSNLQKKIDDKHQAIKDAKNELKDLKHEAKGSDSVTLTRKIEKKKAAIERLKEQLFKLEVSQTDKTENKEIALGTSKLNYLDPRISIAWCLKNEVPIEKIYNKTQRQKFAWAIDMTEKDFVF